MNALENVVSKGKSLVVERSASNAYGYMYVCKKHQDGGPRYDAKKKLDGEPKPRHVPGSLQRPPVLAAAALAYFEAGCMGALKAKKDYAERKTAEVSIPASQIQC
jgi:hypothetical protein